MIKKSITKLIKKSDKYNPGIDYLRVVIEENIECVESILDLLQLMDRLDFDNSNFATIPFSDFRLSLMKIKTDKGIGIIGSLFYDSVSVPIFMIEKFGDKTKELTKTFGRIDIYGMYFRLIEIGYILDKKEGIKEWIKNKLGNKRISRLDYKIDFFYNIENQKILLPKHITKIRSNSKIDLKTIGGQINSWRLGSRKSKQYLIRAYDKLIDTNAKGKFLFYKDYFKYKKVYRLEFEFMNHFCKGFTFEKLNELLIKIKQFLEVDKEYGNLLNTNNNIDINEVKDRYKYADSARGYMKGCINAGINIFGLLDEVFMSLGKTDDQIIKIMQDYLFRKKTFSNYVDKEDVLLLFNDLKKIYG